MHSCKLKLKLFGKFGSVNPNFPYSYSAAANEWTLDEIQKKGPC